jgi:molybdopterin molybdotransferase
MTGAIIKKPFDTVIPIEQIEYFPNKDKAKYILIRNKVNKHNYFRFEGSDYKKGQKIISIGEIIRSSHILAFKTLGIDKVLVKKKPVLVFYATGNEISDSRKIPIWKVRNSNGHYLSLPITFKTQKILRDNDQKIFKKEIKKHLKSNTNIIITSGAVSAGKFDFVPGIIKDFKLANSFKGVAIRPGKPILFSKFKNKNTAFFGLPGNPISSAACFRFFIFPFLFTSLNIKKEKPFKVKLKNVFIKKKNFTRFIKGKISFSNKGLIEFEVLKGQESFRINSFTKANSWGFFPSGKSKFKKGQFIDCFTVLPEGEMLIN